MPGRQSSHFPFFISHQSWMENTLCNYHLQWYRRGGVYSPWHSVHQWLWWRAASEGKQPPHVHTNPPVTRDVTKALPVIIHQHAEVNCPSSAGFCLMRGGSPGPHGAAGQLTRWRQSLSNSDGDDRVGVDAFLTGMVSEHGCDAYVCLN